jgi:pimeloyl-ACP methyl ester carboxylesterase
VRRGVDALPARLGDGGALSSLTYDHVGSGPPLLLLHGIGSSRKAWAPVVERLAAERAVFAVDLPGFGDAGPQPDGLDPTPAGLAGAVAGWLDGLGLATVHCAGSSLGGWVALELARLGRARSVAALSPAGFWSDRDQRLAHLQLVLQRRVTELLVSEGRPEMSPRVERALRTAVARVLLQSRVYARPWLVPVSDALDSVRYLALAPGWDATLAALTGDRYRAPEGGDAGVPVTVAWGAKDRLLPPRQRARAREQLPGARVGLLPGCGHLPMWDDPELVARVLLHASAGLETPPAPRAG